jgi:hypothetical protein
MSGLKPGPISEATATTKARSNDKSDGIPQGLKPDLFCSLDVRAKARTYPRSNNNDNNKAKRNDKSRNQLQQPKKCTA